MVVVIMIIATLRIVTVLVRIGRAGNTHEDINNDNSNANINDTWYTAPVTCFFDSSLWVPASRRPSMAALTVTTSAPRLLAPREPSGLWDSTPPNVQGPQYLHQTITAFPHMETRVLTILVVGAPYRNKGS